MTEPGGTRHDLIELERTFAVPPRQLFAAFSDDSIRRRWIRMPGSGASYEHEFSAGGGEVARSGFTLPDGTPQILENRLRYLDIVPEKRLVWAYEAEVDAVVRWISLVTVELEPVDDDQTRLTWVEQVTFLVRTGDGSADVPHLRGAIALRFNGLSVAVS